MSVFILSNKLFLITLIFSFCLSLLPFFIYRLTNSDTAKDSLFEFALIVTTPIVYLIMYFIGTNIALSIGLVGSLSVIRFRTAVKSPKDLIYLLFAISIGVGLGSQNLKITIVATVLVGLFAWVVDKIFFHNASGEGTYLNFEVIEGEVDTFIDEYLKDSSIEIISISRMERKTSLNIKTSGGKVQGLELYRKVSKNSAVRNVQLFDC